MTTTTTLTSKGQITIPKELREKLNLRKGDKLVLVEEDGNILQGIVRRGAPAGAQTLQVRRFDPRRSI